MENIIELTGKYTSAKIYATTVEEGVYNQVYDIINNRAFDGQKVVCMPDVHVGASGPCGLVATIGDYVCPEHIGVDIGCSVSMMVLDKKLPEDKYAEFEHRIQQTVPMGANVNERPIIDEKEFFRFLTKQFNVYRQYWPEMLSDLPDTVTEKWVDGVLRRVGMDTGLFYKSLGSIGGGNHFIEYDEGVEKAGVTLHFGSRNFGVKVCKYWMKIAKAGISKKDIKEATAAFKEDYVKAGKSMKEFGPALQSHIDTILKKCNTGYLTGENMKGYLCDMALCQLYAQFNHLTVQKEITKILQKYNIHVKDTITSVHNFIDLRDHVLRKSAIRSYEGETILVPFNMADGIAVCKGKSNEDWLCSCAHGAGRKMSRTQAKANLTMDEFQEAMKDVYSTTVCEATIDESPMAYKETNEIVDLIKETCDIVEIMKPIINIKSTGKE